MSLTEPHDGELEAMREWTKGHIAPPYKNRCMIDAQSAFRAGVAWRYERIAALEADLAEINEALNDNEGHNAACGIRKLKAERDALHAEANALRASRDECIAALELRLTELESVLADANQRDMIVLRAQKAQLESQLTQALDEVARCWELTQQTVMDDDVLLNDIFDNRSAVVQAMLAAREKSAP